MAGNLFGAAGAEARGPAGAMETKVELRTRMLALRRALPAGERGARSLAAQQHLLDHALFREARALGLYRPLPSEVATNRLIERAQVEGKRVFLPAIAPGGDVLEWIELTAGTAFARHALGFEAPEEGARAHLRDLDLVVVPGVAFDPSGHRLGLGKGFYDRALAQRGPALRTVGLAFALQVVDAVPAETHDIPVDWLCTEESLRPCCPSPNIEIKPSR